MPAAKTVEHLDSRRDHHRHTGPGLDCLAAIPMLPVSLRLGMDGWTMGPGGALFVLINVTFNIAWGIQH